MQPAVTQPTEGRKRTHARNKSNPVGPDLQKMQKVQLTDLLLDNLPSAEKYEFSFMHKDTVTNILCSNKQDLIITFSVDGHVKFWRKVFLLIESLRNFKAHNGLIVGAALSREHTFLATVGVDKTLKLFDLLSCDLRSVVKLQFSPSCIDFVPQNVYDWQLLAVGEDKTGRIILLDLESDRRKFPVQEDPQPQLSTSAQKKEPYLVVETLGFHRHPVCFIRMNSQLGFCISIDERATIEIWDPLTLDFPKNCRYRCKIETDLLKLTHLNSSPLCLTLSPQGKYMGIALKDRTIRVFNLETGKMTHTIQETLKNIAAIQDNASHPDHSQYLLEEAEFDRKMALEKDLEVCKDYLFNPSVEFNESEELLLYSSFHGIKFYSLKTQKIERVVGKGEAERFLRLCLFQGRIMRNPAGSSTNQGERKAADPTLFCTSFKRPRFFIFSRRNPDATPETLHHRDIINERTNREEQQLANELRHKNTKKEVIFQTTLGDIHLELFVEDCPKTCENFIKLTAKGYYDGLIFHRVIKGFMVQGGCPRGDGTGGESIWGSYFGDQLLPEKYRFEKAYLLAMANRGPNTNGSQFFITVIPCPWLNNKHTIFGRVTKGIETVCEINKLKTDKNDKPLSNIKIISAKVN